MFIDTGEHKEHRQLKEHRAGVWCIHKLEWKQNKQQSERLFTQTNQKSKAKHKSLVNSMSTSGSSYSLMLNCFMDFFCSPLYVTCDFHPTSCDSQSSVELWLTLAWLCTAFHECVFKWWATTMTVMLTKLVRSSDTTLRLIERVSRWIM